MRHATEIPQRARAFRRAPRLEEGFSLVEVLIAAALLLIIVVGVLPLFTQSMINNNSGNNATRTTNYARAQLEERFSLPFNGQGSNVAAGTTETVLDQVFATGDTEELFDGGERWYSDAETPAGISLWNRQTTVRQYSISDIGSRSNTDKRFDRPLNGSIDPSFVHVKELEVILSPTGENTLTQKQDLQIRLLKSF